MAFRALAHIVCLFILFCTSPLVASARMVTDATGEKITLPDRPLRVVSLAPSLTEIVFSLEKESSLKGVTRYSDFPEEARALPKVGSYIKPELERIVRLKPDLCLAVLDGNPPKVLQRLKRFGIPVFIVNPNGIDAILRSINQVGEALDAQEKALKITSKMQRRLDTIDKAVSQAAHRPKLFFQIGISPIVSVGKGTFLDEMIRRAGGDNVVTSKTPYPRYSTEQVLTLAPEMIIITSMARDDIFDAVRRKWESWPTLPAVKNSAVHLVNSDILDRPTPRVVDGLLMLARLIQPQLIESTQL